MGNDKPKELKKYNSHSRFVKNVVTELKEKGWSFVYNKSQLELVREVVEIEVVSESSSGINIKIAGRFRRMPRNKVV